MLKLDLMRYDKILLKYIFFLKNIHNLMNDQHMKDQARLSIQYYNINFLFQN